MKKTCKKCSEYSTCTSLCPQMEEYVSQDEVPQEFLYEINDSVNEDLVLWDEIEGLKIGSVKELAHLLTLIERSPLTPEERTILLLVGEGVSQKVIGQQFGIQQRGAGKRIHKILNKLGAWAEKDLKGL